jgi:N utilization substance protein B
MSSRRIARELAVILLPQLPKDKKKLEKIEFDTLVVRSINMLTEYAKQCLTEANSFLVKAQQDLLEQTIDHPDNATQVHDLRPVRVTSDQLREHLELMERAIHLTSEALDIPQMSEPSLDKTFLCQLVSTYVDHRDEIDQTIRRFKEKWRLERMVSIDRDIIRLACAEAFYTPDVPINVAISEAVELSHRFADERAAKFINGVLADIAEQAQHYRQTGKLKDEPSSTEAKT